MEQAELTRLAARIQPIDGGFRVKTTDTHYIDVLQQLVNWRIVTTPRDSPMTWDRGWCYAGLSRQSLANAIVAALAWDGSNETEPEGWTKNIQTGEWRPSSD